MDEPLMPSRALPEFLASVSNALLSQSERSDASIFAIDRQQRLLYYNQAYLRFSTTNGGPGPDAWRMWLGRSVMEAVPPVLHSFYAGLFARALEQGDALRPTQHVYQCSTPDTFREFVMSVYAVSNEVLLVVNSLSVEHVVSMRQGPPPKSDQAIRQCANCRRTLDPSLAAWIWVPELVARPTKRVTHTVCGECAAHYYPEIDGLGA